MYGFCWYKIQQTFEMKYSAASCQELVRACVESSNVEAWQEFVARFQKVIIAVVWHVAQRYGEASRAVIEDLVQETYAKLCKDRCRALSDFDPRHEEAFYGMVKVTAANVARDYFRAFTARKRGSGKPQAEVPEELPSSSQEAAIERSVLLAEIDKILSTITSSPRDREIFWLFYRHGFTANDIASIPTYGLTPKGVESLILRLRTQLRAKLCQQDDNLVAKAGFEGVGQEKTLLNKEEQS
jgi:RNA polymerase sigma-70 factor (ECF subfamily)